MGPASYLNDSARWVAVSERDPAAEGSFVYCVKTTKIFCRPTCSARLARRANVEFFDSAAEAVSAGYRACKRCQPTMEHFIPNNAKMIRKVTLILDQLPAGASTPSLDELSQEAKMTKHHFHRSFKKLTGLTPKDYVLAKQQNHSVNSPQTANETRTTTPALTDDSSLMSCTNEVSSELISFVNSPTWDTLDLGNFSTLDAFDWQDIQISELDSYFDEFCELQEPS